MTYQWNDQKKFGQPSWLKLFFKFIMVNILLFAKIFLNQPTFMLQ